jgi:PEP-CTERM motif
MGHDAANDPNGVVNAGGDEPNPQNDNQKFGAPFASDRGIVRAADIGILFNATEPAGDAISIDDITLKFFLDSTLVGSIDGSHAFPSTEPGNGVAGFVFRVDAAEMDYVNAILALGNIRFALESTLSGNFGGPESFWIVNLNGGGSGSGQTIPEPASLLLIGTAMLAAGWRLRNGKPRVSSKT